MESHAAAGPAVNGRRMDVRAVDATADRLDEPPVDRADDASVIVGQLLERAIAQPDALAGSTFRTRFVPEAGKHSGDAVDVG